MFVTTLPRKLLESKQSISPAKFDFDSDLEKKIVSLFPGQETPQTGLGWARMAESERHLP
jgi:hypothetical protein